MKIKLPLQFLRIDRSGKSKEAVSMRVEQVDESTYVGFTKRKDGLISFGKLIRSGRDGSHLSVNQPQSWRSQEKK